MRRWLIGALATAVVTAMCAGVTLAEGAPTAPDRDQDRLDAYTATVAPSELSVITEQGLDVTGQRRVKGGGLEVELVMSPAHIAVTTAVASAPMSQRRISPPLPRRTPSLRSLALMPCPRNEHGTVFSRRARKPRTGHRTQR